jgi:hypothetical protein
LRWWLAWALLQWCCLRLHYFLLANKDPLGSADTLGPQIARQSPVSLGTSPLLGPDRQNRCMQHVTTPPGLGTLSGVGGGPENGTPDGFQRCGAAFSAQSCLMHINTGQRWPLSILDRLRAS